MLLSVCGCALGLMRRQELLAYISLATLIWVIVEWLLFRFRVGVVSRSIEVTRTLNDGGRVETLWMNRPVAVRLSLKVSVPGGIPLVRVQDYLPAGLESEETGHIFQVSLRESAVHEYTLVPKAAGRYELPGVTMRISDLHGLFFTQQFAECQDSFRVMPSCQPADSFPVMTKQNNSMMPPGMHRFLRAGSGPELLELREYVPGDPPKSIAWKVSARKGELMTRQYESEVPVRVTLFVDGSTGARVGRPGHRALDTIVLTAASLAKAVMADRDPVGLVSYNDIGTTRIKHGTGERHLFRMLDALANLSFIEKLAPMGYSERLFNQAWTIMEDRYPQLLEPSVNQTPFFLFPLLPHQRRRVKRRLQLATALAEQFDLPADASVRLALDDAVLAKFVCMFLNRMGAPWTNAIYNSHGANLTANDGRLGVLTDALTRAIATARDNEVFVLVADLIDHPGKPGRLLHAVRVARARKHRVVVICPWPTPVALDKLADFPEDVAEIAQQAEQLRLDNAAERLRSEFRRVMVPFVMATEGKSVRLVMAEAGLARDGRTTIVGAR